MMNKLVIWAVAGMMLAGCNSDTARLAANLPTNDNVLFWTVPQRDAAFRQMERLTSDNVIAAGDTVAPLPAGPPLVLDGLDAYFASQRLAGLMIIHDGRVRLEKYGLDYSAAGRWTSFSVAKSFTSTLVGAAIKDGHIKSLDDKVSAYIPGLAGSAYDDVSVRDLLTMSSGVRWNEDYADPDSDVAKFSAHKAAAGEDVTVSYMKRLPREAAPGTRWQYNTGETNLIGVLVSSATGKTVSAYLSEKLWARYGMAQDAVWLTGSSGHEISGCCISASLQDYARFGLFMLGGGVVDGQPILPDGWIAAATAKQRDIGAAGRGYGYQWWTNDDGSYSAQGIFGQGIFIDPARKLVIAGNGNWPKATDPDTVGAAREAFYRQVQAAIDAEAAL